MMKSSITIVLALSLGAACSKKSNEGTGSSAKASEPAKAGAPAGAMAAPGGDVKDAADYEARSTAMVQKVNAILSSTSDCTKLTADLGHAADELKPEFAALRAWEGKHPDEASAATHKVNEATAASSDKTKPNFDACKSDQAFMTAYNRASSGDS